MARLLKNFEPNNFSLDGYGAANGNQVGVRRLAVENSHKRLISQKKDPGPKPEVLSPDGYSGVRGGAARLKYTPG
jgi:hypothetical protein